MRYLVKAVEYVSDYKVKVSFADQSVKIVDLESILWGPVFEPLHDIEFFRTVRVDPELQTIVWDNGADVAPEFLYENGVDVSDVA